ncbi:adenylate/guanylate cyclase domain-containing protein [Malaciobacter halophilus]|uniref:Adenylate/guanylate cyclase domain-containing protein n=1 Tax=Malaciobacter halophilus TaxID=197482 RepID=A0A2N1J3C0_9BACT|nr:adenylate/guanylate cyclase domain-containing protein [Malaciobacter halophilus]AXH09149.1 CHASE2 sensor-containing adenylate/guanylate cyclase [Malaciobacter halophilus]PKI81055.1 adenylate/guanylate cyclase domain-containing protein [Malaciobacter halophilus]
MKGLIKYLLIFITVFCSIFFTYQSKPALFDAIDNEIESFLLKYKNKNHTNSKNIVIIDIDDKSINQTTQWPWKRDIFAKLIDELQTNQIKAIGIDIVFSQEDRSSPSTVLKTLNIDIKKQLPNYDKIFANSIKNSSKPVVLGYHFLNTKFDLQNVQKPYIPAMYIKSKNSDINLIKAKDINLNIPIIQNSSYSSGFLNIINNKQVLKKAPLLVEYKNEIYPSLALEIIRVVKQNKKVLLRKNKDLYNEIKLKDLDIKVDEQASLKLSYYNKNCFVKIKAIDILNKNYDKTILKDKIVLLGSSASGIVDLNTTITNEKLSSTVIHATIIENILNGDFLIDANWQENFISATIFIIFVSLFLTLFLNSLFITSFVCLILTFFIAFVICYFFYFQGIIISISYIILALISSYICSTAIIFTKNRKELITLKKKFAAKVSNDVMGDILKDDNNHYLRTKQKDITIFFSDIVGFSKITNQILDPEKLTKYLNEYMNPMTKIIMKNKGTVDKFIGDSIMAYWNAPSSTNNHQDLALCSALEQLKVLKKLNKIYEKKSLPKIDIRIGINSGKAYVGEMGADDRNDYTAIGSEVNKASILEQACKIYKTSCIISQSVKIALKKDYTLRFLDTICIDNNVKSSFNIYEVFKEGKPSIEEQKEIQLFEEALKFYYKKEFVKALDIFKSLQNKDNKLNSNSIEFHINRCTKCLEGYSFSPVTIINKKLISK